jgi:membrane-associated phospholipid phosphatase
MRSTFPIAIAVALTVLLGAGWWGGPGQPVEVEWVRSLAAARLAHPTIDSFARSVTMLGGVAVLAPLALGAGLWLAVRRKVDDGLFVVATAFSARILLEILKHVIDRPRPDLAPFPVDVSSSSFPSGHATNSMATFLVIALALAPATHRTKAIAAAVLASVAVGLSRPLLGVHWPSDVVAGWTLGAAWVAICWALVRHRAETAA